MKSRNEKCESTEMSLELLQEFGNGNENAVACDFAVNLLVNIASARDGATGRHARRVQEYVLVLAKNLRLNPKYSGRLGDEWISNLLKVVPLHDVGKIRIPDRILLKPGKLTSEEYEVMKSHTSLGHDIIAASTKDCFELLRPMPQHPARLGKHSALLQTAMDVALRHHERWDGAGYPDGLAGEEIPLAARVVAVADVFDAMTTLRVYQDALPVNVAIGKITAGSGHAFDPDVVAAFMKGLPEIEAIASRRLRTVRTRPVPRENACKLQEERPAAPDKNNAEEGAGDPPDESAQKTEVNMRALIVDDDELDRKLLQRVLAPFCTVETAESGFAALAMFRRALEENRPFGLVCLDYNLPAMNGAQIAQGIRDIEKICNAKAVSTICAVSGAAEAGAQFYLRLGDDPHFFLNQKPYNRTNLLRAIGNGLRRWGCSDTPLFAEANNRQPEALWAW